MTKLKIIIMILKEILGKKRKSTINQIKFQIKMFFHFLYSQIMNQKNISFLKEIQEKLRYLTDYSYYIFQIIYN